MKSLTSILNYLKSLQYLNASLNENGKICNICLLSNGIQLYKQIFQNWQFTKCDDEAMKIFDHTKQSTQLCSTQKVRSDFIYTQNFRHNLKTLNLPVLNKSVYPILIKSKYLKLMGGSIFDSLFEFNLNQPDATHLVSDYFFYPDSGLEKFYSIQRERKIWWMKYSANPSRYFIEPFEMTNCVEGVSKNSQSITINSRFWFGTAALEEVTLVYLNREKLEDFELSNTQKKHTLPAVIRSTVNLEVATCALLLDGYDHKRVNTLLLNRKLAPYQCAIVCFYQDKLLPDLNELSAHISCVLHRAGLRNLNKNVFTNCKKQLYSELLAADRIGIPYVIILDEQTLTTGFLKLRNRDTTLEETIHISDIPTYLLNIYTN